jgi:hypothetical protein
VPAWGTTLLPASAGGGDDPPVGDGRRLAFVENAHWHDAADQHSCDELEERRGHAPGERTSAHDLVSPFDGRIWTTTV